MKTRLAHYLDSDVYWFVFFGSAVVPAVVAAFIEADALSLIWGWIALVPNWLMVLVGLAVLPTRAQGPLLQGNGWSLGVRTFFVGVVLCMAAAYWLTILGSTLAWTLFFPTFAGLAVVATVDTHAPVNRS